MSTFLVKLGNLCADITILQLEKPKEKAWQLSEIQIPMNFMPLSAGFFSSKDCDIGQWQSVCQQPLALASCSLCGTLRPFVKNTYHAMSN